MPLYRLPEDDPHWFPPVKDALPDGLLAVGGDLRPERLLAAYRKGIFPWYNEEEPPLWWSPDPRCVLFPEKLHVSHSMRSLLRGDAFEFKIDSDFEGVMRGCRSVLRPGQDGTWITGDVIDAYVALYRMGIAHSAEAWQDGKLVAGLYGVRLGDVFFGESMFSTVSNGSKWAFVKWVEALRARGVGLIDCQVETSHLMSLGAELISRSRFGQILDTLID